jgi:ring-1,2-phenylacetyl-CoA epoxidase subunit PaaD
MCGSEVMDRSGAAWRVLSALPDPEVPAISLVELGIVRGVILRDDGGVQVVLTPTYSGCPATEAIERSVRDALDEAGLGPADIVLQRAPAWTTDWISDEGRAKLRAYGIAPPGRCGEATAQPIRFHAAPAVDCPRCGSSRTQRLSAFGSTACKSLYRCLACAEPFEQFKPL